MTNTINLDLADVLEAKLQFGFSVPVTIDVDQLLEYADDDWTHELDLDRLLAEQKKAAVIFSAADVQREYPHLSDDQAWEAVAALRDQFQDSVSDFVGDIVWMNYPSDGMQLTQRIRKTRMDLDGRTDDRAVALRSELSVLERMLSGSGDNTDICDAVTAILNEIDSSLKTGGEA